MILRKVQSNIFKKQQKTYLLYEHPLFQDEPPLWLDKVTFLVASIGTATRENGWFWEVKFCV